MKFKVGDQVLVTGGKDKGTKSVILKVIPDDNKVVVKDANMYVRHVRPYGDKSGEIRRFERPLTVANIAIINDEGKQDRIKIKTEKTGDKVRVFSKTGKLIPTTKPEKTK